jgi:hypothetical protein
MNDDNRLHEALVALFGLGVVAFSPLILDVFDGPQAYDLPLTAPPPTIFGIPLLYAYLFVAWAVLIALMALAVHRAGDFVDIMPLPNDQDENE